MASSTSTAGEPAALARHQAQSILTERRFRSGPIPRPLHGLLSDVGRALESPLEALNELVEKLGTITPGGTIVVWAVLAVILLGLSALLATHGARRSLRDRDTSAGTATGARPLSAAALERSALAAEREGHHAEAVRLRFRAGLMQLAEKQLVAPSMLNVEVSRALGSRRFDELARRFDEIVYGGRPALEDDVRISRVEWAELLNSRDSR
jgi:hypothetical protein